MFHNSTVIRAINSEMRRYVIDFLLTDSLPLCNYLRDTGHCQSGPLPSDSRLQWRPIRVALICTAESIALIRDGYGDQYLTNGRAAWLVRRRSDDAFLLYGSIARLTPCSSVQLHPVDPSLLHLWTVSTRYNTQVMSAMYSTISLPYNFLKQAPRRDHSEHSGCGALRPPKRVSSLCKGLRSFPVQLLQPFLHSVANKITRYCLTRWNLQNGIHWCEHRWIILK